jgi:hypothetical protein
MVTVLPTVMPSSTMKTLRPGIDMTKYKVEEN